MNYGQLKTRVLADGHRADLTAEVAGFIASTEARIARELRAREMIRRYTLAEVDRESEGIYNLPAGFLEERGFYIVGRKLALDKVGLGELITYATSGPVHCYATIGGEDSGGQVEFRAVPATDQEIPLVYFARPTAFSADADESVLLTNHEDIYIQGGLFYLHKHAENVELAQGALDLFGDAIAMLNEQASRYLGGTRFGNAYNLGNVTVSRGY